MRHGCGVRERHAEAGVPRTRRVLLVDDDEWVRDALAELLSLEGFAVDTARNGLEALERLHEGPTPCVILVDLLMPVMDGWQFCAAQSQDPELRDIPVAIVSATGEPLDPPHRVRAAGFFRKPADLKALIATLERYCS